MEQIKQLIWDWNGTLLDDVEMCVRVMNGLLSKYKLPLLSPERYKQLFDFPVHDYYLKLGFDFDTLSFEKVGHEFMAAYFKELPKSALFSDVHKLLAEFDRLGLNQVVLSAMEHQALENSLHEKGIRPYFSIVQGIDNHLANGKEELGEALLNRSGFSASETLLLGDTLHDLQVANSISCSCVLIANGHFSKERLLAQHDLVFDTLSDFMCFYKANR
ncbi:MAG: HAD family hydrolase [Bacteroidales bacterium]|nr:HAD family hydrolase [Bacteroidales bacterium]